MIALLEHKIKEQKSMQIIRKITPEWAWLNNYEYSSGVEYGCCGIQMK